MKVDGPSDPICPYFLSCNFQKPQKHHQTEQRKVHLVRWISILSLVFSIAALSTGASAISKIPELHAGSWWAGFISLFASIIGIVYGSIKVTHKMRLLFIFSGLLTIAVVIVGIIIDSYVLIPLSTTNECFPVYKNFSGFIGDNHQTASLCCQKHAESQTNYFCLAPPNIQSDFVSGDCICCGTSNSGEWFGSAKSCEVLNNSYRESLVGTFICNIIITILFSLSTLIAIFIDHENTTRKKRETQETRPVAIPIVIISNQNISVQEMGYLSPIQQISSPQSPTPLGYIAKLQPFSGENWEKNEEEEEKKSKRTKRNGFGTYHWKNGDKYEGTWLNDQRHGQGTHWWYNGARYEGDWVDDLQTGYGKMFWISGNLYVGEWFEGKMSGKGTKYWTTGDRYEGQWCNDNREGNGIYIWATGSRYEGEWLNDKKHGKGTIYWKSGAKYFGDWVDNKMHGFGIKTFANGDQFEGQWLYDKRNGSGKMIYANGIQEYGHWDKDNKISEVSQDKMGST